MDASDKTKQRKGRTLFADRVVQQTIFDKGLRNWIVLEGGVHTGRGAMTFDPNYYNMQEGAGETTEAEFNALIAGVPNKFPDPPTNVVATLVSGQVIVSFSAPAYTGTTPITSYTVTSNPGGIRITGASPPITMTGLTVGQTYTFTVTATNSGGSSIPSAPSNSVATATVPDAPTAVSGVAGNEEITVSFTAPASDGGSAILDYTVTGYVSDVSFGTIVGSGSPITYSDLSNGTAYTFTVKARNEVGYSAESTPSVAVTPVGPPEAPTNLAVIPTVGGALIYFTAPNDGGSPITNYQYSTDGGTFWSFAGTTSSPVTVIGLDTVTVYSIKLRAVNAVDPGAESVAVTATGLTTFSPANISSLNVWLDSHVTANADISGGRVTAWNDRSSADNDFTASATGIITYDLPSGINNRPALNFTTSSPTTSTYLTKNVNLAPTNQLTVFMVVRQTGKGTPGNCELFFTRNDFRYFDIFSRTNSDGILCSVIGSFTNTSSGVDIINTPPTNALISLVTDATTYMYVNGATTDVSGAARGSLSLNTALDWALSGAAFLGNYGELICYSAALSTGDRQSVEGYLAWKWGMQEDLPVGHPYRSGPPAGPPLVPTSLVATAGDTTASIAFTAGYDGGSAITNYEYSTSTDISIIPPFTAFSPAQTTSPVTITGLTNGQLYYVWLKAVNAIGVSEISSAVTVTPTPPPSGNLYTAPSVTSGVTTVAQSPFSGGGNSYSFNGTSNFLNVVSDDSWDLGTGDFTIEWFQYQTDSNLYTRIFAIGNTTTTNVSIQCSIESGTFYGWFSSPATSFGTVTPFKNAWQHFAIVRSSSVLRAYKNGQQIGSSSSNTTNIANSVPLYFGVEDNPNITIKSQTYFGGYLTNIRIVKGLAVYTGTFTTPTSALTLTPGANPYGGSNTVAIPAGFTKLLFVP